MSSKEAVIKKENNTKKEPDKKDISKVSKEKTAKKEQNLSKEETPVKTIIYPEKTEESSDNKINEKIAIENPKAVFSPIMKLGETEYLTNINGKKLLELWKNRIIEYYPDIQRGNTTKVDKDMNEVEVPVFSTANVKSIANSIKNGKYFTDMITINIIKDGNETLNIDDKSLTVLKGIIAVADGQHRIRALEQIEATNEARSSAFDLEKIIWPMKITILDLQNAQQQFYQFSKGLKISSSRSEFFNSKDKTNLLVKNLMSRGNSLFDRVEYVKNTISKKDTKHLVSFATLVNAIDKVYLADNNKDKRKNDRKTKKSNSKTDKKVFDEKEYNEVKEYLNEFFKILFEMIPELHDYDKRTESKELSLIAENIMFYGYVKISYMLYIFPDWKEKMPLILKLDFNKSKTGPWYGGVTKKGRNGYSIINSSDSRDKLIKGIEHDFSALLKEHNFEKQDNN